MKTFLKITFAALAVLLTLTLVTCDDFLGLNPKEDEVDYVDWEYEDMPDGTSQLTVYLDGTLVPVTEKTGKPKPSRALNLQLAKMSHDYFEVVFWNKTTDTPETIARATWELGQAAGISGVYRSGGGVDYSSNLTTETTKGASVIFVGRKQTMTLLGVGVLTQINKKDLTGGELLKSSDRSVTFTVSPLTSKIAIDSATGLSPTDPVSSFITAGVSPWTSPSGTTTVGRITGLGGTDYPLFILPDYDTHSIAAGGSGPKVLADGTTSTIINSTAVLYKTVAAQYTIGGLTLASAPTGTTIVDFAEAVRLLDRPEVIKREPRYISGGQTWYATAQVDFGGTEVDIPASGGYGTFAAGMKFDPVLPIEFYLTPTSNGIFSIVFSIPVYALTMGPFETGTTPKPNSDNGGPPAEIWHITPGYGQNLYNLDNGSDAGGCVLLGINVSSLDWLEIFTTGLGFKN